MNKEEFIAQICLIVLLTPTTIVILCKFIYFVALLCRILYHKLGYGNCFFTTIFGRDYYIRPWKFRLATYRKRFPRRVITAANMTNEMIAELEKSLKK